MKKPYFFGQHNKSGQNIVSAHTAWPSFPSLHFVVMALGILRCAHMQMCAHMCTQISVTFISFSPRLLPFAYIILRAGASTSQKWSRGTSLVVQWLRLHIPSAGGPGLILGQGTISPHAATKTQCSQINIYFLMGFITLLE